MTQNDVVCQLNDFLKGLKPEYSKYISSQSKRLMFLLDERNFIANLSVYVDTDALKTVFDVLVKNAVKYTDKGYVKSGYRILENNVLQFFVEDTGNGFDQATLEKMTAVFDSDGGSSGGAVENLVDLNGFIKSMSGKIRVDSQQGIGTTVYFSVEYKPVIVESSGEESQAENAETQTNQESSSQSKTSSINNTWEGKTILIAEDEIVNYMFLEVLLEETGAVLIHACDGQQAIDAVKSNSKIDLILMDIKMPNVNGLDATRQIKAVRPQVPVIAQTAYAMQDDEYKALQAGCNEYISKPIDANKLIGLMKKYLK